MTFLNSWLGWATLFYFLIAIVGFFMVNDEREARSSEDHMWHDEGMTSLSAKEYRHRIVFAVVFMPFCGLSILQVIYVPAHLAPGSIPSGVDIMARAIFSASVVITAGQSIRRLMKTLKGGGLSFSFFLRITLILIFLLSLALYPWISRMTPWWQSEVFSLGISFALSIFLGLYLKLKQI